MKSKGKISIYPSVIKQIILETIKEIPELVSINKPTKTTFFKSDTNLKDLEVEMTDTECVIDMSVILKYGCKLTDVASKIQDLVEEKVEELTTIKVKEINVNIVGVSKINKEKDGDQNV